MNKADLPTNYMEKFCYRDKLSNIIYPLKRTFIVATKNVPNQGFRMNNEYAVLCLSTKIYAISHDKMIIITGKT
uniref:Uncharacterized protein n=1 Tax=Rhizophagus irregularis (strain DAOM 181602 / DAOM 197198 / MUCL 43194) TaxID=747089 RepID=U9U7V8_RHIID